MAAPPSGPSNSRPDSRRLADFAAKAAETFVSAYYAASDSPQRTNLVPTLYLPTSSIVWNGTPVSGQQELTAMLNSMPGSKHEVQAFDCHALGGAVDGASFTPPSITLSVSGTVSHHTPESSSALHPSTSAPKSATSSTHGVNRNRTNFDPDAPITSHPRAFSQNFVLVNTDGEGGVACSSNVGKEGSVTLTGKYVVQADSFRFVG
ncbi:Nuclear pore RNA shuttling protein Mtr2 [Kalmanozyma brasiliensis GHG001]|uniref:Nuclear transport factor n=1 Tax=Kalmanozyma brasiliensis (strain GHG001) TaxID=1365824 RepID=V5EXN5_KALBG|nr:Nuclear pore RNA shuttling protein Mtr2 [Kalmanozyma brasiliensis GHG001]EST08303.1 Nuclear pore RNA shuttling protein Mtr2 [Kalmanozyma brasiliensis GHG001]